MDRCPDRLTAVFRMMRARSTTSLSSALLVLTATASPVTSTTSVTSPT
jgi:hypothetical protein